MSTYESAWMRRDGDDFEEGVPNLKVRKQERAGKPRAAQFDSLDARLAEIRADAHARWQEHRDTA